MTKAPVDLQDLRRRIYVKAKAEPSWRFWGLYVHVCKMETLQAAYKLSKENNGAPGADGVTFESAQDAVLRVRQGSFTARPGSSIWREASASIFLALNSSASADP